MPWDERQHAMLAEMGVRVWSLPAAVTASQAADDLPASIDSDRLQPTSPDHVPQDVVPMPDAAESATAWQVLQRAVAECTACALHLGRQQAVFGDGVAPADWLVVVDPPTDADEQAGAPAAGRDGVLLDQMLKAVGVTRRAPADEMTNAQPAGRAFVTPVLKCRPPLNRAPQPAELAECDALLLRQLALVRPKVVLAMGRFAVQALLHTELPIGKLRGQVHRPPRLNGVPVVVTYPAAFLLRNPADKAKAWDDLCLAHSLLGTATASGSDTAHAPSHAPL